MNKKILMLIPTLALIAVGSVGCNNKDEEDDEEVCEYDAATYGTEEAPLTVAQLQTNVAKVVQAEEGYFSCFQFHVKAKMDNNSSLDVTHGTWNTFYLKDTVGAQGNGFKVQRATSETLSLGDMICQGDEVQMSGYAEYYAGGYSFFPKDDIAPSIYKCNRGSSTFQIETPTADITYSIEGESEIKSSYPNMTKLVLTATTSKPGFGVIVKNNGAVVKANGEGKFEIYIKGNTKLTLKSDWAGDRIDLPVGSHDFALTPENSELTKQAGTGDTTIDYSVVADDEGASKYYKRLHGKYNKYCYNNPTYANELMFEKGKGVALFTTDSGKITKVQIDYYSGENASVFLGESQASTDKVSSTENTTAPKTDSNFSKVYDYTLETPSASITIAAGSSYACNFYKITFTIVVGS